MTVNDESDKQLSLFNNDVDSSLDSDQIILPNLDLLLFKYFFSSTEADQIFEELITTTVWRQDKIKMYNKVINLPRLTAWFGDSATNYKYSGIYMNPVTWTPMLFSVKTKIETAVKYKFNSVLLNLYRDGNDSVGWHQDNEPELGQNPTIASVSLGASRQFQLKHITENLQQLNITLHHGSLLLMRSETQHFWKHQIPKTKKDVKPRINLTFRYIHNKYGYSQDTNKNRI